MFGGASPFSFGNTATSTPFGTTSTTATSTPASSGFLFGSTSTPAAAAAPASLNSTFTFGATPTNTATATGTTSQPLTFGTGLQNNSTIRPFGSTGAFGTTPTSTTATTGFGGSSLFGSNTTATQPTSIFGSTGSTFGATPATSTTTTMFGATPAATQQGTTVKYEPVSGQDTMRTKNNTFQTISTKLQCICAMKEYLNKSMEELRMEDYLSNRKFGTTTSSLFGGTSSFNPSPFGATTAFPSAAPATSSTTSLFGNTTTTASPFSAQPVSSTPFTFNTTQSSTTNLFGAPTTTTASPFGTATSTAPATGSIFGTTQPSTSIFGSTNNTSPFGAKPATTQPAFGFGTTTTSTASPFTFGSQPATSTSLFSQPATSTPFGSTAPTTTTSIFGAPTSTTNAAPAITNPFGTPAPSTNIFGTSTSTAAPVFGAATTTPAFTGFGTPATSSTATNIFGTPAATTSTAAPMFGGFGTQPATSTASPFSFNTTSTTPSLFGTTGTTAAVPAASNTSIFNSQPFGGFSTNPTQPASSGTLPFGFSAPFGSTGTMPTATTGFAAPAATTAFPSTQVQQQSPQSPIASIHQRVLAASLIDPFFSRGKKDFTDLDQIKPPTDLIVLPTSSSASTTTTTTTTTTSTSIATPITLPLQSNLRKASARPLVDIRFRLKPVSSSPTTNLPNEEIKSPNPTSISSTAQVKSPLMGDFSEEEELALIGKNKLSKLRLSNDFIHTSFPSESIRSLYPMRQLSELETLSNLNNNTHIISSVQTNPSTTTIDTVPANVNNDRTSLHPTSSSTTTTTMNRPILPLHHSTPLIVHKQVSPPVSHLSTTIVPSPTSPPAPSTTPPLPSTKSTVTSSNESVKSNTRAHRLPILTRPQYYTKPSFNELKSRYDNQGQCIVDQFTVGHDEYGSVTFYGKVNVAGLDLDKIIHIDRHEVTVYPDDENKPAVGVELNIPARITLIGVYPTDRTTREEIRNVERIKAMNYVDYLRDVTKKFDGEFVDYGFVDGSWTFMVKHFTRYGLDGNDDEEFLVAKAPQTNIPVAKPINPNFLDQTIGLNDTYALASSKSQQMDTEEKENRMTTRSLHQSLIGLQPDAVEQLVQKMFDDDDDDDEFQSHVGLTLDPMATSTKIITSQVQRIPPREKSPPIIRMDDEPNPPNQLTFVAPEKPQRQRVHSTLPKNIARIRGKYFRTNFSADLRFASIDPLNETRILIENPMRFNEEILDELPNFFELYYSSCVEISSTNNVDLPLFQVHQNERVVQRCIDFYHQILDEKNFDEKNSLNAYSLEVFQLCQLLWAPIEKPINIRLINENYFEEQKRRESLSNWLDQCILSRTQNEQWAMEICEYLSRGLFAESVKFARDEGDLRLAALIHAASGSNLVRDILRHCANEDIVDLYSRDFQRTIAVLSGEFHVKGVNLVDRNRTIFWQMAFALHLRFANATSDSISTIVRDFETAFHEHFWLEPFAHYGQTKSFDLRWKLLKLYTDETYPMEEIFDVSSYTSNPLDYRLSWMLYMIMRSLGANPLSTENDTNLHIHFAEQLENLGLWKFAIFVLLHIQDAKNRMKLVDEFLHRHVTSNVELSEDEHFLIEKYHLPSIRLLLAKGQRAEYEKQWQNAVRLWIDAKQWRRAHDTFCSFVFHDILLHGSFEFGKHVLDTLDHQRANISHWNRRGGFVRLYLELLILIEKIHHGQTNLSHRNQTNLLTLVHRLSDQLNDVIGEHFLKKISLVDISRRLLSILNYNVICSNLPNFNEDTEENLAKKSHLFHQSVLSSVPCSLPLEILVEQIQYHRRSNRS